MFCTHCGTQVADTDKFCPECGAPIERPAAPETTLSYSPEGEAAAPVGDDVPYAPPAATYTAPAAQPTDTPAPKKRSHKARWIVLTCVVLTVALAAAAIFVWRPWSRYSVPDTPATDPTAPTATEEPPAALTPEETIRAAFGKLDEADSMHLDFAEDISMTVGMPSIGYSQSMDVSLVLGCDSDKVNGTSRIEGGMSAMGFEQSVLAYSETVDGKVLTYTSTDGGATWTRRDGADGTDGALSDPTASIDLWMKHAKDFTETGTEQVNGFDTTVYAGKLAGEYVKDAAGMTGVAAPDEAMLNDLDDLPITFWIDNESGRVVRMEIDMKAMMATIMEKTLLDSVGELPAGVELSVDISKASISCDLKQFNEIPPIVIPDEARVAGPEAESIVGTWTLCGGEDEETQQYAELMVSLGMEMVFVFNEDGTGSVSTVFQGEEDKEEFTYTLGDGEIVINGKGAPYRIEDDLLHLTADDAKLIFKRK